MKERRSSSVRRRFSSNVSLGLVLIVTCCFYDTIGRYVDATKLRMCIVESSHTAKKINKLCPRLKTNDGNQVECVVVNDRVNCLRRLTDGDAEFTILEPEDLVLVEANAEYDIVVTNELRLFRNDTQRFSMVAIVANKIKSAFDLMGTNLCHGGYESSDDSSRVFATYFQNWIIPRKCDRDKTLVENEISSLADFFGSACIPGAWTFDSTYDAHLKSKYRNLCALCDNPAGCYNSDKYQGREGALLCLTENAADVAWVRLEDALRHFKTLGINETKYSYLCPDGTTRRMELGRPCVWIRRPWPVVVATRSNAESVARVVDSLGQRKFSWQNDVAQLMQSYRVTPVTTGTLPTPDDFLRRYAGFASANTRAGCTPSRTIRWCVASNLEDRKCRTMKEVAQAYGIRPSISCIQRTNLTGCLEAIRTGSTDIFVVKSEDEFEARLTPLGKLRCLHFSKSYTTSCVAWIWGECFHTYEREGSRSLIRAITKKRQDINVIAALVRNDSHYRSLEDLRGARACFTGYRSIGWNTFVDIMSINTNNENWNCSDLRGVSNFFKDSCVPGLADAKLKHPVPSNLYSLCQRGARELNSTAAAYACLNSGRGDVAFVSLENGLDNKRGSIPTLGRNLRSICIDSSVRKEESCRLLAFGELATVMTNENTTELRSEEIYSTLLEIDILFGKNFPGSTPAFSLYGPYDSSRDIIFPERTQHLQREFDDPRLPRNYVEVVERLVNREKTYNYCSKANRPTLYSSLAAIFMSITIISASIA